MTTALTTAAALLAVLLVVAVCIALRLAWQLRDARRQALRDATPVALPTRQRLDSSSDALSLQTPYVDWHPGGSYACFLSHYKLEAGTDPGHTRCRISAIWLLRYVAEPFKWLHAGTPGWARCTVAIGTHASPCSLPNRLEQPCG